MNRYVTIANRPRAGVSDYLHDYVDDRQGVTVVEDIQEPVDTGLFDHLGRPLYRLPDTVPMGFHRGGAKS